MSHKVNLVRVLTAATGNSTPITLGAAYSQLFMTPAEAGAMNGRVYTYLIVDGNDWELGKGVYTSSGTTLARTTILASRVSGTLGTSRISLSGTAQVRFAEVAEDMDGVRGTRAVTGTTDVIANSDQGYAITYSNAASIAVTLAQAAASNLFIDGWATTVQNLGAGTVTITPATSTINGASTLMLAQNMGAFIWSDGTNYHAAFMPVTKPLLAGNNLSDGTAATMRTNLGGTTVGQALFTATDAAAAQTAAGGTTTGKALFTATDAAAARTTLGYKWEPIAADTVTSAASWTATGLSAYRMLRLSLKLRSAVSDAFINFRTSSNNGSSYDSTSGDYLTTNMIGNGTTVVSASNSEAALTLGGSGSTSPLAASHTIMLFDFNQAEYCFIQSQGFAIASTNVRTVETRGCARAQATARDAIQITLSSGNIAKGIFILEGVKG